MHCEKKDSVMKETLRRLCCSNGWCYGIFWGFDLRNSLLLTSKDAYYQEQMGALIDNMLMQVHVLGRGTIGQAAFTKNHKWMFSDFHRERHECLGSSAGLDMLENDSDLGMQFLMGIKTVALISVEPWGVVQFGSTRKILESKDLIHQVKQAFRGMDEERKLELPEAEPSSSDSDFLNSAAQFSTLMSRFASGSAIENFPHCTNSQGFIDSDCLLTSTSQLFSSGLDHHNSNLLFSATSLVDKSNSPLDQLLFEPGSSFDCSILTSSWSHFPSGISGYECSTSSRLDALSVPLLQSQQFSKETNSTVFDPMDLSVPRPSGQLTLDELFRDNAAAEDLCKACPVDDFSQWFPTLPCPSNTSVSTVLNNVQSHTTGLVPVPKSSGHNSPSGVAENHPTNSMQSSVTDAFMSKDDKIHDMSGIDRLLNTLRVERGCEKTQGWDEPMVPVVDGVGLDLTNVSCCLSEKAFGSSVGTSNSLFSRLGLDQLLDGRSSSSYSFLKSQFEGRSSSTAKRRKVDNCSWSQDLVTKNGSTELKSETSTREPELCVGESSIMCAGSTSSSKKQHESAKTGKKKAKPGTRPRPKDRQMIQDRLAELRGLIPNGDKMSIDRLLERTIRHLNFMSSLAKHSESLKQVDQTKNQTVPEGHPSDDSGITWACEVGDKSMVCPLIVEDLRTPGQMLIEMLYEERGFFLEIVDVLRGFGLTILKGVMEVRETKIWARFVVETKGNRHCTRHEIFSSLIQLLQMTGGNSPKANAHFGNNISSSSTPFFNNYQPVTSFPVDLADAVQCANL